MTTRVYLHESGKWACERTLPNGGVATNYWEDDARNEDGSTPEGWRSGEEKAREDAAGAGGGCC